MSTSQKNKMNSEYGWTKEMIDEIKDCKFYSKLSILIKIQDTHNKFTDEEYIFLGDAEKTSESYEGIFNRGAYCYDDIDDDYDEEKYNIWKGIYISIQFLDHSTRKFEDLSSETYKYGYLAFWNQQIDVISPALTIGLNKECGIKEKIDDLFIKSKIFNHKDLNMDIEYDCEFIKDIEYDKFFSDKAHRNLVPIKCIDLGARFGLD